MRTSRKTRRVRNMFYWPGLMGLSLIVLMLVFAMQCENDDDPQPIPDSNSITDQFTTTDEAGTIELDGYTLEIMPGSIPTLANGDPATVTFSIETELELPKALPPGIDQVGKTVHFGPEGFVFRSPILLKFPLPEEYTPDKVSIIFYDDESDDWRVMPTTYVDLENREIGTFVLSLDYFTLGYVEEINRPRDDQFSGGINWNLSSGSYPPVPPGWNSLNTYIILTVKSFVPKYTYSTNFVPARRQVAMTPSITTGGSPNHSIGIRSFFRQGTYEFWVSAQRRVGGVLSGEIETKCYTVPITVNIDQSVTCQWSFCNGWTSMPTLPGGGTWFDGRCGEWPSHTVPVCTGDFQATLTWFNGSGSYGETDLDLQLYGPDDLHVYYQNKTPGVADIILDRDIISDPGDAQENICAPVMANMPSGDYRVAVQHFSGQPKDFQVRLIRGNSSKNFSGSIDANYTPKAENGKPEMTIFEFTLN